MPQPPEFRREKGRAGLHAFAAQFVDSNTVVCAADGESVAKRRSG
jgi:hypothetical protein